MAGPVGKMGHAVEIVAVAVRHLYAFAGDSLACDIFGDDFFCLTLNPAVLPGDRPRDGDGSNPESYDPRRNQGLCNPGQVRALVHLAYARQHIATGEQPHQQGNVGRPGFHEIDIHKSITADNAGTDTKGHKACNENQQDFCGVLLEILAELTGFQEVSCLGFGKDTFPFAELALRAVRRIFFSVAPDAIQRFDFPGTAAIGAGLFIFLAYALALLAKFRMPYGKGNIPAQAIDMNGDGFLLNSCWLDGFLRLCHRFSTFNGLDEILSSSTIYLFECLSLRLSKKSPGLFRGIFDKRFGLRNLAKAANHVTSANRRTDDACHVGAHGVHQEEVLRIVLRALDLGDTGCHRYCGDARGTDEGVHRILGGELVHDFRKEETAGRGETEGYHAHADNQQGLGTQEDVCGHGETHGSAKEDGHDVHQLVLAGLHETVHDAGFLHDVAQHEHCDEGGGVGHHQDADNHHHHRESDTLGLGDLAQGLHADLAFLVVGHGSHDRRLDKRNKSHVGVGRHGDGAAKMLGQLVCGEDGRRTVGATDDTDGSRLAQGEAAEGDGAEHGGKYAELRATAKKQGAGVGNQGAEVRHGTHAQEDDGREEFQVDALADVVVETFGRHEHTFDAPATVVESLGGDVHRESPQSNRQEQQRFVFFDDCQVHQDETDNPHHDHKRRDACKASVASELDNGVKD